MTAPFRLPSGDSIRPSQGLAASSVIWLVAGGEAMPTLGAELAPYGCCVLRFDPQDSLPAGTDWPEPEIIMVDALSGGRSIVEHVGDATALPTHPGVVVIDRGLDAIDRILALESGADDCVAWPCPPREFVARMHAISRRRRSVALLETTPPTPHEADEPERLLFAGWTLDRQQRQLGRPGQGTETLSTAEFAVLDQLVRQPRRVIARDTLLEATAPETGEETRNLRAIDIQVSRLRRRLAVDGEEIIRTVRGSGYMLLATVTPG